MTDDRHITPSGEAHGRNWSGSSDLGRLEQRVIYNERGLDELKDSVKDLNKSISDLNSNISDIGKPQYHVWAAFGTLFSSIISGVFGFVWWMTITPINEHLKSIEINLATGIPREVHLKQWADIDKEISRMQKSIDELVTKDTYNNKLIEFNGRFSKEEAAIDELRRSKK